MKPSPNRPSRLLPFIFILFTVSSCYQYKLYQRDATTASLPETKLVYSYFWGIKSPEIKIADCHGNGFDRVVVKTNLVNSFVTIISLGIVSPMRVYWECAKDPNESPLEPIDSGK